MSDKTSYRYDDNSNKLLKKSQEAPMFPIAIGVLSMAVAYGAYMFKNKGKMSTSVYLMHLRVGAQGAAVGALTCGLAYTMVKQYIFKEE
ncbi:HIG1 domain family member 1A, mitochondrial-like isoform X2 [Coccinella septempunctata]|nr:HIG1 domain family member 1A, mitochondrial-like isoform X2 [Coccinella septempunctata]